jgi:beta-lactamase class A
MHYTPLQLHIEKDESRLFKIIAAFSLLLNIAIGAFAALPYLPQSTPIAYAGVQLPTPTPVTTDNTTTSSAHLKKVRATASASLEKLIEKELENSTGDYAVVVKNLTTGETYSREGSRVFRSASLYKLWVMAVVYDQIKAGTLKKTEVLSSDVEAINKYFGISSDEADLQSGSVSFTVDQALSEMITNSHNYAALLLSKRVGIEKINAFLKKQGMTRSSFNQPTVTTAANMATFFEKLYGDKLNEARYTNEMLALLEDQNLNYAIPKYIPKDIRIAHKTGTLGPVTHDAGIVYGEGGDYIIVVMSETVNTIQAEKHMSNISRDVYDYFAKK